MGSTNRNKVIEATYCTFLTPNKMRFTFIFVLAALATQAFAAPSWPGIGPLTNDDDWNCDLSSWGTPSKDLFDCEPFTVEPVSEPAFCSPTKAAAPAVCGSGYGYTPSWDCASGRSCGKDGFF